MASPPITRKRVSELKSVIMNPALTSHFLCEFTLPGASRTFMDDRALSGFSGAKYGNINNQELIQLSCSDATLPGSSLATSEINNDYSGVTERHAYRRLYDDRADFTFYVDNDYKILDFFENWISYIAGEDDLREQRSPNYTYRVNFPKNYYSPSMYIVKFEKDYKRAFSYKYINAFPISINSMPVSYDSSQLLKCTVSFSYSRYVIGRTTAFGENDTVLNLRYADGSIKDFKLVTPNSESTNVPFGTLAQLAEQGVFGPQTPPQ